MKLHYWKSKSGNVGDDLNPWLFNKLFPTVFTEKSKTALLGIGTQINDVLLSRINAEKIVVFSTGVGYGTRHFVNLPIVDETWDIICLRGPLSAQALQVSQDLAITDGGLLVKKFFDPNQYTKKHKFSFMPHLKQAVEGGNSWKIVCERAGFQYIDPRWSVEKVVEAITTSEVILTEAMHGAILADTMRVPWIAIQTSSEVFGFKWLDWCLSVGVPYRPETLPNLQDPTRKKLTIDPWIQKREAVSTMTKIAKTILPVLSKDAQIDLLSNRLDEKLYQLKEKIATNFYP